jgi:flagellar L-ring protein precursor FlgH
MSSTSRRLALPALLGLCLALSACETFNPRPKVDLAQPLYAAPQVVQAPRQTNGSIYQASQYRPMFEDHRARLVGDALLVRIAEKVSASQSSASSVDKSGSIKAGISAMPFISPNSFGRASALGSSENSFAGKGSTENSNDFSGTITAIVTEVLPNGHLVVAGEKQVGVNHNVDILRFTGQVDPRAIQPGNTVASAQIANVRIENRGRGAQADAQGIAWLARFFLSVLPL